MAAETVKLWLTRDRTGASLWRRRPRYCFGSNAYWNGGEALPLDDDAFANLHVGACVQVEVSIPE